MITRHNSPGIYHLAIKDSECVEDVEVCMIAMTIPPHTKLSRKWKPGDDFACVLDGFFILHQENRADEFFKKGDIGTIPPAETHTISTQEEGATILIFQIKGMV